MIEFMPWYGAGESLVRCVGDNGCGAILSNGDIELHKKWHSRVADGAVPGPVHRVRGKD